MTNEKAIENLKLIKKQFHKYDFTLPLDMAISALEEKIQKDHIDESGNKLSCVNCDRFGIDCGDCEVSSDDQ